MSMVGSDNSLVKKDWKGSYTLNTNILWFDRYEVSKLTTANID